jgi:tripartite-type tricarboxylate transporter receptor subunit TctC
MGFQPFVRLFCSELRMTEDTGMAGRGGSWVRPAAMAFVMVGALSGGALAQSSEDPSKTVSMLASHAPGGGYDAYARLYARHVGRFLPGQPNLIVRNMPGAAGVVMANFVASQAPRNGSLIALGPGSMATASLLGSQGARYDAREFTWVGSLNNDVSVTVSRSDSPVSATEEIFTKELVVGGAGASDNSVVFATILNRMFGAKLKLVAGYNGSGDTVMALDRGEVQGIAGWNYSSVTTMRPDWLRDKKINILLQMSLTRHPDLPNVPTVLELARDDSQREILRLIFAQSQMGRVIMGPPGVPKAMVEAHRAAFDRVLKDPEFLTDVEKMRLEISGPMSGVEVDQLVAGLYKATPERIKEAGVLLGGN